MRRGSSRRISVSVPLGSRGEAAALAGMIRGFSSKQFIAALGYPFLEDLEDDAQAQERSISNLCHRRLLEYYRRIASDEGTLPLPLQQFEGNGATLGVTFRENAKSGIHGWYPYVEGFSARYVRELTLAEARQPRAIYDPFAGSGITPVTASHLGIRSFYSEINPFMAFVCRTKLESALWAIQNRDKFDPIARSFITQLQSSRFHQIAKGIDLTAHDTAFPERNFFEQQHLRALLAAKKTALDTSQPNQHAQHLLLLACASNVVSSSNMTRRADLRRRKPGEYKDRIVDVPSSIIASVERILRDLPSMPRTTAPSTFVSEDCRVIPSEFNGAFDFVLTSPPYLNGTNYFRNTKLELWFLDFIKTERDLSDFTHKALASGINNVNRTRQIAHRYDPVEQVAVRLDQTAEDDRIPCLVRSYFSDMGDVLQSVHQSLAERGTVVIDIGDSKFYGIHVPTDKLLVHVATEHGFVITEQRIIARRHSRDKTPLRQVEIRLRKAAARLTQIPVSTGSLEHRISQFRAQMPFKKSEYVSRNWGHAFHSLSSFQGKLKPSLAHWLVRSFTDPDATIIDPLGGVGTVPFEAALQGRTALSNDQNPFAATVAAAKLSPPSITEAIDCLDRLLHRLSEITITESDWRSADFGLNGSVKDYYHPKTLEEILRARRLFLSRQIWTNGEMFVWANLLHILHGNRPYALSRTSHPITPFHPKGPVEYKSLAEKLRNRVSRMSALKLPNNFRAGVGLQGDFRDLVPKYSATADVVITSPPFPGMRFDRPNWLRMWFCGWNERDFHIKSLTFLERQQTKSLNCYRDFFMVSSGLLKHRGLLIMHLGGGRDSFVRDLAELAREHFQLVDEIRENVEGIEQHGLRDKGRTIQHCLLFLRCRR